MTKNKNNNLWLIVFGVIIMILLIWIIFSNINKEAPVTCQKPYIMGDDGKCCKDIDNNNFCDPNELKISIPSHGVGITETSGVQRIHEKVCNVDEYSGNIIAYFGDWKPFNSVEYRQQGYNLDDITTIPERKDFLTKEVFLNPGECYEFEFNSVYNPNQWNEIKLETIPIFF